jgi:hypothetical protein
MPQSRQSRQPQTLASIGRQLSRALKNEDAKPHAVDELLWQPHAQKKPTRS